QLDGLAGWMMETSSALSACSEETIATGSLTLPLPGQ
ncbi:MAG TPA: ubiquinol-cytochrome C chaperone, partial [Agrobacterium sp.]|nr:ubiquinol-cytochrome C chaperone [Agrobacterium sp.]